MKIIDLLNKIANGEEVPKRIKYEKHIYEYEEGTYDWSYYIQNNGTIKFLLTDVFNSDDNILNILNNEVEIIEDIQKVQVEMTQKQYDEYLDEKYKYMEKVKNYQPEPSYLLPKEKKIPEKLKIEQDTPSSNYYIRNENGTKCGLTKHSKMIAETLNQVIDYLKSKGE